MLPATLSSRGRGQQVASGERGPRAPARALQQGTAEQFQLGQCPKGQLLPPSCTRSPAGSLARGEPLPARAVLPRPPPGARTPVPPAHGSRQRPRAWKQHPAAFASRQSSEPGAGAGAGAGAGGGRRSCGFLPPPADTDRRGRTTAPGLRRGDCCLFRLSNGRVPPPPRTGHQLCAEFARSRGWRWLDVASRPESWAQHVGTSSSAAREGKRGHGSRSQPSRAAGGQAVARPSWKACERPSLEGQPQPPAPPRRSSARDVQERGRAGSCSPVQQLPGLDPKPVRGELARRAQPGAQSDFPLGLKWPQQKPQPVSWFCGKKFPQEKLQAKRDQKKTRWYSQRSPKRARLAGARREEVLGHFWSPGKHRGDALGQCWSCRIRHG